MFCQNKFVITLQFSFIISTVFASFKTENMFRLKPFGLLLKTVYTRSTGVNTNFFKVNFASVAIPDNKWITDVIKDNEDVAYFGADRVKSIFDVFQHYGFTTDTYVEVIKKNPHVLGLNSKEIDYRLRIWRTANFTPTQFYDLMAYCPELLNIRDETRMLKRFSQLQEILKTPKNVWRTLMSCPNVMVDNIETIQKKTDYILQVMEADISDLVKSGSLGLPLRKIKMRHMLLVRLGIYKKRNMRASELSLNKNPRLMRIMDSSEKVFANKTCGISMNEFEAFDALYERELDEEIQEQIDYEENSDDELDNSDSDDDDNNFDPRESADHYDDRNKRRYNKTNQKKYT